VIAPGVRAALSIFDGDGLHAGGLRRGNAGSGVFDHHTVAGMNAQSLSRFAVTLRVGFADSNILG
jgi:hypothetical protein